MKRIKKGKKSYDVKYLASLGISAYDTDNLYPQHLSALIENSTYGKSCYLRYAEFIEGAGINAGNTAYSVINRRGDTVDDIIHYVAGDLAKFGGFALHLNYNGLGEVASVTHVPFENCRLCEPDDYGYVSKIAVHPDWSGWKTYNGQRITVKEENVDYIIVFNLNQEKVLQEIETAGGVEFYKGQIMWVSMDGNFIYPTARYSAGLISLSTDEGLANIAYRNVRNCFIPAQVFLTQKNQTVTEGDDRDSDLAIDFDNALAQFQGDENSNSVMALSVDDPSQMPSMLNLQSKNYDVEFTVTEDKTARRIYTAFGQEPFFAIVDGSAGFSGNYAEDAYTYYTSITRRERELIKRNLGKAFFNWHEKNKSFDFTIQPLRYNETEENDN